MDHAVALVQVTIGAAVISPLAMAQAAKMTKYNYRWLYSKSKLDN